MAEQQEQVTQEQVAIPTYNYNGLEISMPASVIEPLISYFENQARDFGITEESKIVDFTKSILAAQFAAQIRAKKSVAGEKLVAINEELNTQKTVMEYLGGLKDALKRYNAAFGTEFALTNLTSDSVKATAKAFPTAVPIFAQRKGFSVSYVDVEGEDGYEIVIPLTGDMVLKRDALKAYAIEFVEGQLGKEIPFAVTLDANGNVVGVLQDLKTPKAESADGEKAKSGGRSKIKTVRLNKGGERTDDAEALVHWMKNEGLFGDRTMQSIDEEGKKYGFSNMLRAEDQKKYGFLVWNRDANRNYIPYGHETEYPFGNK